MKKIILIILIAAVLLITGCESDTALGEYSTFTCFKDIPGVTQEEIEAIEALRENREYLIYGMELSIEAFINTYGEVKGFSAYLTEWLSELFQIPFVIELMYWNEILDGLLDGSVDFTGEMTATEERMNPTDPNQKPYFMTDAIAQRSIVYLSLIDTPPIEEIAMTRKPVLALLDGTSTMDKVNHYSTFDFDMVLIEEYEDAYELLINGTIDALVAENVAEAIFSEHGNVVASEYLPLLFSPVSLTTQNPELLPIISIVQKALDNGAMQHLTHLYNQGYLQYRHKQFYSQLSHLEKNFVGRHIESATPILIGLEFDNYPTSFFNTQADAWQGIAFDVLSEIEVLTGLRFAVVHDKKTLFTELLEMLQKNEIAIVSEVIPTPEREGRFLWPEPYASDEYALISLMDFKDIQANEVLYLTVGVQKGTAYEEVFRQWFPNHINIVEYDDALSALNALERREIDLFMGTRKLLLYATHYLERPGYKANIVFNRTYDSVFGISVDEPVLHSVISKAQGMIDTKAINDRWMTRVFDYTSAAAEARIPYLISSFIFFMCVMTLLIFMFVRGRRLNAQLEATVAERTAELKEQINVAVTASKAKSSFLATMSHEIRTPLNAIIGISQILLHKDKSAEDYEESIYKIYNSGNILLKIINDILDLSKIETGKMELNPTEYDIVSLINDTVQLNIIRIGSKEISFILDIDEDVPKKMIGDELRLKQILNNLLSNAVKYTEKGFVKLSVSHLIQGEKIALKLIIRDTGQGMNSEDMEKLFSEYLRFNLEANRAAEGTGIGLNITKSLVELMDGSIEVESEFGKGSIFTVTVMQKAVECEAIGFELSQQLRDFIFTENKNYIKQNDIHAAHAPIPYGKVLIVDDVETNLYVAKGLLSQYGLTIDTAKSGYETIDMIKEGKTYDIIFMDHMMPHMDGVEATQKLRSMGYEHAIVALTANALVGNDVMFAENGFDGFIPKPIDIRRLDMVLEKFIREKYPEEATKYTRMVALDRPQTNEAVDHTTNPKLIEVFLRDAGKAVKTLRETVQNNDIKLFTTTVHAMKTALAIIGENKISSIAADLENAGIKGDIDFISDNAENFVLQLEALIELLYIAEISNDNISDIPDVSDLESTPEDTAFLKDELIKLKTACEEYDNTSAYEILDLLKGTVRLPDTVAILENIYDMIYLHSDFDGAEMEIEKLLLKLT